jgi:hypothetical protein
MNDEYWNLKTIRTTDDIDDIPYSGLIENPDDYDTFTILNYERSTGDGSKIDIYDGPLDFELKEGDSRRTVEEQIEDVERLLSVNPPGSR